MEQVLFIVWRESVEAMLVVGILYTWLRSTPEGKRGLKYLWGGVGAGLALAVASERMLERAKTVPERGAYLDVVTFDEAAAEMQPTNTPAISFYYALAAQLGRITAEGGVETRWRRHEAMRQAVERWVAGSGGALGFSYLPAEGRRSWTVSCLKVPGGKNGRAIAQALGERGWTIGSGYGSLKESTIRIGHMGDHTVDGVCGVLAEVEAAAR